MTSGPFALVTDRGESKRAFDAFRSAFVAGARLHRDHRVGFQGGAVTVPVYWRETERIWGVFEAQAPAIKGERGKRHRFWNVFGVDDPSRHSMLGITVELNPPHEGENLRVAGVFLRDPAGQYFIGHTGKVGGGRKGVGQAAFRSFAETMAWNEISGSRGVREVLVLGPFDRNGFIGELAQFVRDVARFKTAATA